jgi:hypothetical protein
MTPEGAMATDPVLQEMIDEFQLRKLVHAYCRAVDRGEFEQLRNLYHHDAVDSHGAFSAGSADEFLNHLIAARPYIRSMQHNITTVSFAISGDAAEGEIYTIAMHSPSARTMWHHRTGARQRDAHRRLMPEAEWLSASVD